MADSADPKHVQITGASLHPTYWGSLIALLLSMLISSISIAQYGMPYYVLEYPESQRAEVFFGAMGISFIFALRYYFLLSFNLLGSPRGDLFTLPPVIKKLIYWKLSIICILCILLANAIMAVRAEWSIFACFLMSGLTILTWFACFIISYFRKIQRVNGYQVIDDIILFIIAAVILGILLMGIESNMGRALPFFALGAFFVFANGFIRWFLPAISKDWKDLTAALSS